MSLVDNHGVDDNIPGGCAARGVRHGVVCAHAMCNNANYLEIS